MKRVSVDKTTKLLIVKYKFRKKHKDRELATKKIISTITHKTYSHKLDAFLMSPDGKTIQKLWDHGFKFPKDWKHVAGGVPKPVDTAIKDQDKPYLKIKIPKGIEFLRPYQKEAIQFLRYNKGRGLLAEDMGVGKTAEALAWIKLVQPKGPSIMIVPSITKPGWKQSFERWVGTNVEILNGKKPYPLQMRTHYIINWEILQYWVHELLCFPFSTVVADESQYVGNNKAKRTKALKMLAKKFKYFIPMSGTPINSKPAQFFPILNLLDPAEFPSEWRFLNRYCDPKSNGFGMTYKGATNTEELHSKVKKLMIRRMKRDILKDLPPVTHQVLPLDLGSSIKKYKKLEQVFYDTYDPHSTFTLQMENDFNNIKIQMFDWKFDSICKWIDDFLESGCKLLVGCWHKHVITTLYTKYKSNAEMINGSITGKKREKALDNFYNKVDILFLQMKSGGVGLDGLQNVCSDCTFVEFGDTPTIMDQFVARLDRSGQTLPVNVTYLVGQDTMEEDLMESIDEVRNNISAVVDGRPAKDTNLLTVLMNKRRQRIGRYR